MPYATNADLPKVVRDHYENKCLDSFRAAFNAAIADGKDEESAFAIAHSAAQKACPITASESSHSPGDYLIAGDRDQPSTWHLQVRTDGKPDHHLMGAAWAALHGGYRGNKYEGPGKEEAIRKLRALYEAEELPLPAEESLKIMEVSGAIIAEPRGAKWRVRVFEQGLSKNHYPTSDGEKLRLLWTRKSAEAALPHLEGARCFADHAANGQAQSVRNLIGYYSEPELGPKGPEAALTVLESEDWVQRKMLAAWKIGRPLGFSIDAVIGVKPVKHGEVRALEVEEVAAINSVDLVSAASSGGRPLEVLEQDSGGKPSGATKNSSAERSNEKGATMKENVKKVLESLRALPNVGESWLAQATTIEAEAAKEGADHGALLTRASEALSGAAAEAAANGDGGGENHERVAQLETRLEGAEKKQRVAESQLVLNTKVSDSKLPIPLQRLVRDTYRGKECTAEELDKEIKRVREAYGAVLPGPTKISTTPASVGLESRDKAQIALHKLLGVTHDWKRVEEGQMIRWVRGEPLDSSVPSFRGILEAYIHYTGDRNVSGVLDPAKMLRVSEDWLPLSFPNALGDSLTRMLLQGFAAPDYGLDLLVPQGNRKALRDFRTQERIRVGYFGDLPVVDSKVADYAELTAPTDEKATYKAVTFGGLVTIHRETIMNDDLGLVNDTAAKLGRSARRTLAQRVVSMMTANAAIYDGITWFHASSHGANLRTTALSAAEFSAIRTVMRNQTEKDSLKRLGIGPSILVVPHELEGKAKAENMREFTAADFTPSEVRYMFGQNGERIIVSPLLTDATDFYTFADQNDVPCIELGFIQGRQEPDLFLSDGETTSERVFIADRIRYKVRHEYEAVVIDYRGAVRNSVAG